MGKPPIALFKKVFTVQGKGHRVGECHINKLTYHGITEKRVPTSEENGCYSSSLQDYLQIAFRRENVTHTHTHTHAAYLSTPV